MTRSPARLVVALSVAAMLAVFVVYTALAGNSTLQLTPSTLAGRTDNVALVGKVVGPPTGDAHSAGGLRFDVRDISGSSTVLVHVVYHGSVPPLFTSGRDIVLNGRVEDGGFVGARDSLVTKCPSHYTPAPSSSKS